MKRWLLVLTIISVLAGAGAGLWAAGMLWGNRTGQPLTGAGEVKMTGDPEISGWAAWWKEDPAYELIASYSGKINTVSPVWWLVDERMNLKQAGKADRIKAVGKMKFLGVKVMPTLGSELTGVKLSPLFENGASDGLISTLVYEAGNLGVDGLDIDLEGIAETDREKFTAFLTKLKSAMRAYNLKLSVTIQAQNGREFWFGARGQDIEQIAGLADEVRIMIYDRHSAVSEPGAIAPLDWARGVIQYNLGLIPKEKIVIGIPSYGYIWPKTGVAKGWQRDEFMEQIREKRYSSIRDAGSGELRFSGEDFSGWLSDAEAIKTKIEAYRKSGLNRFVIWHLGGMDAGIFDTAWK